MKIRPGSGSQRTPPPPSRSTLSRSHARAIAAAGYGGSETTSWYGGLAWPHRYACRQREHLHLGLPVRKQRHHRAMGHHAHESAMTIQGAARDSVSDHPRQSARSPPAAVFPRLARAGRPRRSLDWPKASPHSPVSRRRPSPSPGSARLAAPRRWSWRARVGELRVLDPDVDQAGTVAMAVRPERRRALQGRRHVRPRCPGVPVHARSGLASSARFDRRSRQRPDASESAASTEFFDGVDLLLDATAEIGRSAALVGVGS